MSPKALMNSTVLYRIRKLAGGVVGTTISASEVGLEAWRIAESIPSGQALACITMPAGRESMAEDTVLWWGGTKTSRGVVLWGTDTTHNLVWIEGIYRDRAAAKKAATACSWNVIQAAQ